MKRTRPYPRAIISRKAARALKAGHPWVFASELVRLEPGDGGVALANGCVVDLFEENGTWQGAGLLSQESVIRVRLLSRNANDLIDEAFWRRRLSWAWRYRREVMDPRSLPGEQPDSSCCRVLFSEADGTPGLVVDRYGDVLVSQVGTVGMELLRNTIYPLLLEVLAEDGQEIRGIFERNDGNSRAKEGLPSYSGWWRCEDAADSFEAELPSKIEVVENGLRFNVDLAHSQKTGLFLDQKYNRRAVSRLAAGRRVLDCFCHVGGFGLNAAAGGAEFVRCVDVSASAIEQAQANARLNGLEDRMGFTCENAFAYLDSLRASKERLREEGGPFDLVVLDPPAFTKSRGSARDAARGYRQINAQAMRMLKRGSYLVSCSCSHFMPTDRFKAVLAEAAHDAGVQLKQIEARQQAPDHPIVLGIPETDYLKLFIFQLV